jgi:predicted AAA+ superfamily ATPase
VVSTETIKSVIVEQEAEMIEKFKRENIIERENQSVVTGYYKPNIALIITGLRRTGKSVFSFSVLKGENFGYANFDDERLSDLNANEMNKVLEAIYSLNTETFLFDEIQNVYGWEKFISRLVQNHRIIITGSNATLMSRELATRLTGRHLDFVLFPFSFTEYLRFNDFEPRREDVYLTFSIAKIKEYLNTYIEMGGIPEGISIGRRFVLQLVN